MEVCPLSWGVMSPPSSTPIRSITGRPSLAPSSCTRCPLGVPYGPLSPRGGQWAYHVPRQFHDGVGSACPPVIMVSATGECRAPVPITYLLVQACQHLWLVDCNDVYQRFTCVSPDHQP